MSETTPGMCKGSDQYECRAGQGTMGRQKIVGGGSEQSVILSVVRMTLEMTDYVNKSNSGSVEYITQTWIRDSLKRSLTTKEQFLVKCFIRILGTRCILLRLIKTRSRMIFTSVCENRLTSVQAKPKEELNMASQPSFSLCNIQRRSCLLQSEWLPQLTSKRSTVWHFCPVGTEGSLAASCSSAVRVNSQACVGREVDVWVVRARRDHQCLIHTPTLFSATNSLLIHIRVLVLNKDVCFQILCLSYSHLPNPPSDFYFLFVYQLSDN